MKYLLKFLLYTLLFFLSFSGFTAINIVECEDAQGNLSFQKVCPPGTIQIGSKNINIGDTDANNNNTIEATIYVVPKCESCEEVREYLQAKDISFTEKDANKDIETQEELTKISGGLNVPTIVINEEVIIGYQRAKIDEVLTKLSSE